MKISLNPKRELFKWGPIDGRPIYPDFWWDGFRDFAKDFHGWPEFILYFSKGRFMCLLDREDLYDIGEKNFKDFIMSDDEFAKQWIKWEKIIFSLKNLIEEVIKQGHKGFKKVDFLETYLEFQKKYAEMWNVGSLPEVANWGGEKMLGDELRKVIKDETSFSLALEALSAPERPSFYQQEEKGLLLLKFLKNNEGLEKQLLEHQHKYFWMLNSYYDTRVLSVDYFREVLAKYTDDQATETLEKIENFTAKIQKKKKRILKKYHLSRKIEKIASRLSFCIWWQDERKKYIFQANYCIDLFLAEISQRFEIEEISLHYYTQEEIKVLLLTGKKVAKSEILKRIENFIGTYNLEIKKPSYSSGEEAWKIIKPFFAKNNYSGTLEFKGTIVSRGLVCGRVKIISSLIENEKMKKGDVLVSAMTAPDLIVAMKKAVAIVTDEGGLTCHAAIVSRELGIPCIVGTKIATQVLHDGDLVEVDANSGVVKILERVS